MSSSGRCNSSWRSQHYKSLFEDKIAGTAGDAWRCFYTDCRLGYIAFSCQDKLKNHIEHAHPEANVQAYLTKSCHWFETVEKPRRTAKQHESQKEMELVLNTTGGVFQEDSAQALGQGRRPQFDLSEYAQTLEEVSLSSSRIRSASSASLKCKEIESPDRYSRSSPYPKIRLDVAVSRDECLKIPSNPYSASPGSQSGASEVSESDPQLDVWREELEHACKWAKEFVFPGLVLRFDLRLKDFWSSTPSTRTHTSAGGARSTDGRGATRAPSSTPSEAPKQRDKRKRGGDEEDDERWSSPGGHLCPNRSSLGSNGHAAQFACLYYKYDSHRYSSGKFKSCPLGYPAMNRLKQHLSNVHAPKYYCSRCKTIFRTEEARNGHWNSHVQCTIAGPLAYFDEMIMTTEKRKAMEKKQRDDSNVEYWFKMWDAFFPNKARPDSPYKVSDPITLIQDIAEHQRYTIPQRYRESYPLRAVPNTVLVEIFDVIMTDLIGEYRSRMLLGPESRNGIAQTPGDVVNITSDSESFPAMETGVSWIDRDAAQYADMFSEHLWDDSQADDLASDQAHEYLGFPTGQNHDDTSRDDLHDY